jgi:hypothetical protein
MRIPYDAGISLEPTSFVGRLGLSLFFDRRICLSCLPPCYPVNHARETRHHVSSIGSAQCPLTGQLAADAYQIDLITGRGMPR